MISYAEYKSLGGEKLTEENAEIYLGLAYYDIDSLTFNRIKKYGFENLTEFQQSVIKKSIVLQADFRLENENWLNSALSQYSINGVSVNYTKSNTVTIRNGVFVPNTVLSILKQSGLCTLNMRI